MKKWDFIDMMKLKLSRCNLKCNLENPYKDEIWLSTKNSNVIKEDLQREDKVID